MYIQPLIVAKENSNYTNFKSKNPIIELLSKEKINEKILKINKNNETKELFNGLSALAMSAVAGLTLVIEKNESAKEFVSKVINDLGLNKSDETSSNDNENMNVQQESEESRKPQDKSVDISELLEESPERNLYLKVASYFSNLDAEYKKLLETKVEKPENKDNEFTLCMMENIFSNLTKPDSLMFFHSYFQALDEKADILDKIAINTASAVKNGESIMHYLVLLNNGRISKEQICRWANFDSLSCDEFMMMRNLFTDEQLNNINNLKKQNDNFKITEIRKTEYENPEQQAYIFKLDLDENMPIVDKLKTVCKVHEAIHGEIKLKESVEHSEDYLLKDIKSELMNNLVKDKRLDAIYNFIKFIKPEALIEYNLSSDDVKFLDKNSEVYTKIKTICSQEIMIFDENNLKVQQLFDVLNDKEIYDNIITSRHAKIRFISRIVLKDNPSLDLKQDTKEKIQILMDALNQELSMCNFFCYIKSKSNAPQFYIRDNRLGKYTKITLNHEGSIHTIFEDFNKELKARQEQETKK